MKTSAALLLRAGVPVPKPIPRHCTIINPLPHANCGTGNVSGYRPHPKFVNETLLYHAHLPSTSPHAEQAKMCMEQCHGYGNPGECKSSFVAFHVPVEKGPHGTSGGEPDIACSLFSSPLNPNLFVLAPEGTYANATAANIYCPEFRVHRNGHGSGHGNGHGNSNGTGTVTEV